MKLLVLGGTVFLGRHVVAAALARGHELTLFNRGQHNPELFPELEKLRGDRGGDLEALAGREWDAVVDLCGYVPRLVRNSAEKLAGAVGQYTFISSISVYADEGAAHIDEQSRVARLADPAVEEITGETYGALKALCEEAAEAALPGRVLVIRPGLIVGPHDPTYRFTYWPARIARGGEVLAPGRPEDPAQFIDARDLAEWTLDLVERGQTGVYNATGPERPLPLGELLDACRAVTGGDAHFTWVDEVFLLAHDVAPFVEMPLWLPDEAAGLRAASIDRALAAGLSFRPLAETIRDTLEWDATLPADTPRRAGIAPERERELLEAYRLREA
jgi:2'-hydroxyisoflavone reductase